jgi:hypothetical protein
MQNSFQEQQGIGIFVSAATYTGIVGEEFTT